MAESSPFHHTRKRGETTKLTVSRDIGNLDQMFSTEPIEKLCRLCNEWLDIPGTPRAILALRLRLFRTGRAYAVQGSDYLFPNDCFDPSAQHAALDSKTSPLDFNSTSKEEVLSPGFRPPSDDYCECEHSGHSPACYGKITKTINGLGYCALCIKTGHYLPNATEWEERR